MSKSWLFGLEREAEIGEPSDLVVSALAIAEQLARLADAAEEQTKIAKEHLSILKANVQILPN